ncbi:hypothetical protein GPAL_0571 [Glaciecola pallidula DSM 14239 = ACAM 615]|uniref:Uncharacterized protein n=1 Tax=Brumicola pallidula DSM 14239 = ACAM 615 TaxID=1121922 RepID=K6YU19_9ALTE|nr:hypothetical protein GPAL_0571 [Glaciecola pallidula DSM 14239 = ACAM 615]
MRERITGNGGTVMFARIYIHDSNELLLAQTKLLTRESKEKISYY